MFLYLIQEIITGAGHSSAIDWWALGKHMLKLDHFVCCQFVLTFT